MTHFIQTKRSGCIALAIYMLLVIAMVSSIPSIDLASTVSDSTGSLLQWLTDSAGSHGFLFSTIALCLIPIYLKLPKSTMLKLGAQLGILLVLSFGAKTLLKQVTAVPRPYANFLQHIDAVKSAETFYQLDVESKNAVIESVSNTVSPWRTSHWLGEMDYSFPSGHTIFVSVCILFFGGILIQHKRYMLFSIILTWGIGVAYSRLWLGMHRPIDLVGSMACAHILYCLIPEQWIQNKVHQVLKVTKQK
ncbi:phosphatase PAP2 family protein [Vibrio clamense]|uniref:phosphatase PAP2 family protein n=1 Tax=Vibrio clamense TaxID=2910254 RepID=UPI003D1F3DF0